MGYQQKIYIVIYDGIFTTVGKCNYIRGAPYHQFKTLTEAKKTADDYLSEKIMELRETRNRVRHITTSNIEDYTNVPETDRY